MQDKENKRIRSSAAEYLTFVAATGYTKQSFEMRYEDENIWLTQKMMAALYDVTVPTVNEHIKKSTKMVSWRNRQRFGNSEQFKPREPGRFPVS